MLPSGGIEESYMYVILGGQVSWQAQRTTPSQLKVNIVSKMLIVSEMCTFRAVNVDLVH